MVHFHLSLGYLHSRSVHIEGLLILPLELFKYPLVLDYGSSELLIFLLFELHFEQAVLLFLQDKQLSLRKLLDLDFLKLNFSQVVINLAFELFYGKNVQLMSFLVFTLLNKEMLFYVFLSVL